MNSDHTPALLFDFDGTLGMSLPHWSEAYREALLEVGVRLSSEEAIEACFHRTQPDVASAYGIPDPLSFRERVWALVKQRMPHVQTYPQVPAVLNKLQERSIGLAVVTNSRRGHVQPVLDRWGFKTHFQAFVSIEDVPEGKPNPKPIEVALKSLARTSSQAWMIGDSVVDIEAGHAAGVKTIAFHPPENRAFVALERLRSAKPTAIISSYQELYAVIPNLN